MDTGAAPGPRAQVAAPHAGEAEVVAHHRDARPAHVAHDGLQPLHLLCLARAVEQHVVPVLRLEVLDRRHLQALGRSIAAPQIAQFLVRPHLFGRQARPIRRE